MMGTESSLTFALPDPMFVAAIRIRCDTPAEIPPTSCSFGVAWKKRDDIAFPPSVQDWKFFDFNGELVVAIADNISEISLCKKTFPKDLDLDLHLSSVEVLVPEGRDAGGPVVLNR
jgi:hypothetical protein